MRNGIEGGLEGVVHSAPHVIYDAKLVPAARHGTDMQQKSDCKLIHGVHCEGAELEPLAWHKRVPRGTPGRTQAQGGIPLVTPSYENTQEEKRP